MSAACYLVILRALADLVIFSSPDCSSVSLPKPQAAVDSDKIFQHFRPTKPAFIDLINLKHGHLSLLDLYHCFCVSSRHTTSFGIIHEIPKKKL